MRVELSSHHQVNHSSFQCTHSSEQQRHFVPVASKPLQKAVTATNFLSSLAWLLWTLIALLEDLGLAPTPTTGSL